MQKGKSFLKSKKGYTGLEDVFYVLVYLFSAAIFLFIIYYAYGEIQEPITSALINSTSDGTNTFNYTSFGEQTSGGITIMNALFPFILIGLIAMVIVSAMFIDSHPIFFFVSLIILGVVVLLAVVFSNIYQEITTSTEFGDAENEFSIVTLIMENMPFIVAAIIIITMIVLWSRPQGGSIRSI